MMFLMENWYLVVALMAVAGMVGVVHRAFSENANIRAEGKSQGMAAVGGHAGRGGAGERHREAEAAADLRFIYPAVPCIGYGGILRHLLPVGG